MPFIWIYGGLRRAAAADDVPDIGGRETARPHDASHFSDAPGRVRNEKHNERHDGRIEGAIGKWQCHCIALSKLRDRCRQPRSCKGQLTFRGIHAFDGHWGAVLDQQLCKRAIATTDVDPSQIGRGREPINQSASGQSTPLAHHPFIDGAVIELDRRRGHWVTSLRRMRQEARHLVIDLKT
jgi:hypothetical protein